MKKYDISNLETISFKISRQYNRNGITTVLMIDQIDSLIGRFVQIYRL